MKKQEYRDIIQAMLNSVKGGMRGADARAVDSRYERKPRDEWEWSLIAEHLMVAYVDLEDIAQPALEDTK